MTLEVIVGDLGDEVHATALKSLLAEYALDPMGGAAALAPELLESLPGNLSSRTDYLFVLAVADGQYVGLVNCFEGFSTFKGKPLINIHDVIVSRRWRGQGIARQMLTQVEDIARQRGCCKLTLEVLEGNKAAQRSYRGLGFEGYQLVPEMGRAMFWEKPL